MHRWEEREICIYSMYHWLSVTFPGTTSLSGGASGTAAAPPPLSFLPLDAIFHQQWLLRAAAVLSSALLCIGFHASLGYHVTYPTDYHVVGQVSANWRGRGFYRHQDNDSRSLYIPYLGLWEVPQSAAIATRRRLLPPLPHSPVGNSASPSLSVAREGSGQADR